MEGIELQNKESIRTLIKKGKLQVLGNIGIRHHQTSRDERKTKRVTQKMRELLKTKLYGRNFIKGINT